VDIRGVVVREGGGSPRVEHLQLGGAGPGEVLVRILASGVCHSDVHYQFGGLGDDFPYLLGHEGAGIVEACGDGVTSVSVGDYVALTYRAPCLSCRFCAAGRPELCVAPLAATTVAERYGLVWVRLRHYRVFAPLTVAINVRPNSSAGHHYSMLFTCLPETSRQTVQWLFTSRDWDLLKPDHEWAEFDAIVMEQDRNIVENQRPEELPLDLSEELHLRGRDAGTLAACSGVWACPGPTDKETDRERTRQCHEVPRRDAAANVDQRAAAAFPP